MFIHKFFLLHLLIIYEKFKQNFIYDVFKFMKLLIDQMNEQSKKEKVEDNLFVKNIIVNKDIRNKKVFPYIATERWINQLGDRLQVNF